MISLRRPSYAAIAALGLAVLTGTAADAQRNDSRKPSLSLQASPSTGFAPLRARLSVDVRGGADDFEDFYCAAVEWEWGDDQKSTHSQDCEPYKAGSSRIERRYTATHTFNDGGTFNVRFRLKQGNRVVANTSVVVRVSDGQRSGDN
jgi:hypothetical protein